MYIASVQMQNEPKCKGRQVQTRYVRWKPDYSTSLSSGLCVIMCYILKCNMFNNVIKTMAFCQKRNHSWQKLKPNLNMYSIRYHS